MICSFLHFGQRSLTNFAVDSRILFFILHLYCLNSTFLALKPPPAAACIFLQTPHWNLKSVFLEVLRPAILHLVIAGFEYLPWFPTPRWPRPLIRTFEPQDSGWALPLVFFLPSIILCSVCFLHVGQYFFRVFGSFIVLWDEKGFKKLTVGCCSQRLFLAL